MARIVLAWLLLAASPAAAGSVFLNGINIDGVTNKTLENCTVQIDADGNVHITTKGRKARPKQTATPRVTPGQKPTRQYWLVTEKAAPGMTQYEIELMINGKHVRNFKSHEEHVVMELTKYMHTGKNEVQFIARKNLRGGRRSQSPQHYFRIVIGEGTSGGRDVMITRKFVDYKRTALETRAFQDKFTVVAR